jgi:putative transposase
MPKIGANLVVSSPIFGARRVWRDILSDGVACGLHKIERPMHAQALRAHPRRRRLPKDERHRSVAVIAPNLLPIDCRPTATVG